MRVIYINFNNFAHVKCSCYVKSVMGYQHKYLKQCITNTLDAQSFLLIDYSNNHLEECV